MLMQLLQNWRERREAMRYLREVERSDYDSLNSLASNPLNQSLECVRVGDMKNGVTFWEKARATMPKHVATSIDCIEILLRLGRHDELEVLLNKRRKDFPLELHYIAGFGFLCEAKDDFKAASDWWQSLRRRAPSDVRGYMKGANCLLKLGKTAEAINVLKDGVRLLPGNWSLWTQLGDFHETLSQWDEALKVWQHIRTKYHDPLGYRKAAQTLLLAGDTAGGLECLRQAHVLFPYNFMVLSDLGRILEQMGDPAAALAIWMDAVRSAPTRKEGYESAITCLSALGRDGEADELRREWEHRSPADPI